MGLLNLPSGHTSCMPALDELGWLQFQRLCELVLEADAGIDPVRWEGSADVGRALVCEDQLRLRRRTLQPPVVVPCRWLRRDDEPLGHPQAYGSVVTFVNRPVVGLD